MSVVKTEVTFSRTVRPADFESKAASCTIGLASDAEGNLISDADRESAMTNAQRTVLRALGLVKDAPSQSSAAVAEAATTAPQSDTQAATQASPTKAAKPPKQKPAPAATAETQTTAPSVAAALDNEPKAVPEAEDVVKAISNKVKELGGFDTGAPIVSALIQKFKPADWDPNVKFSNKNIPPERRAEFIDAVKAIGKTAPSAMDL